MADKNITSHRTPLRNSNYVNKPFRSPFSTESSPLLNAELKKFSATPSPVSKFATPKRHLPGLHNVTKKIRLDVENLETSGSEEPMKKDLLALKNRIRNKRLEIDGLKIKLSYQKKHKKEDLAEEIKKWRSACQKALIQYHKDCVEKYTEGKLEITQILSMLGISHDLVKFSKETEDFC